MSEKTINVEIIDNNSFSYNGHIISINNMKRWIDLNAGGRNIHKLVNSFQVIKSCVYAYLKKSISEKIIYKNMDCCLQVLKDAGFQI